jgi:hypothetical protein
LLTSVDASGWAEYERALAVAAGVEAKQIAFGRWLENNAIAITSFRNSAVAEAVHD